MVKILDSQTFACTAEAVAHYYNQGFVSEAQRELMEKRLRTWKDLWENLENTGERQMFHPDGRKVWIRPNGKTAKERFLNVKATVINENS
jgi:hypothetical protein